MSCANPVSDLHHVNFAFLLSKMDQITHFAVVLCNGDDDHSDGERMTMMMILTMMLMMVTTMLMMVMILIMVIMMVMMVTMMMEMVIMTMIGMMNRDNGE